MKKIALILSFIGLLVLAFLLLSQKPVQIKSISDLDDLEINTQVSLTGKVIQERALYKNNKLLILDNHFEVICECTSNFKDKNVKITGKVEEFNGKKQIRVLNIE